MEESCSLWINGRCSQPYHDCYRRAKQSIDSNSASNGGGICGCSSFYGFEVMEDAGANATLCEGGTLASYLAAVAGSLCFILFLLTAASNAKSLVMLSKSKELKRGRTAAPDNSGSITSNRRWKPQYFMLAFNVMGCIGGLTSQGSLVIAALGYDSDYWLSTILRPLAFSIIGCCILLSDSLLLLSWREVYLRSATMSKSRHEIPGFWYARIAAYALAVLLPAGYIILAILGIKIGSEILACLTALLIGLAIRQIGNNLTTLIFQSQSTALQDVGQRIGKYSTKLALMHYIFVLFNVLHLATVREQGASIVPLIFSVLTETHFSRAFLVFAEYLRPASSSTSTVNPSTSSS